MTGKDGGGDAGIPIHPLNEGQRGFFRLLVIPVVIYVVWLIEIFLLEGNQHTFTRFSPANLLLYTVIVCVLTGIILPILIVRRSFLSGDVNMFQIGFRSLRRTVAACACTVLAGYAVVVLASPFGPDRSSFATAFLLFLPTAMASVMVCWVLIGTHLQAYVRGGGSLVTIPTGVVATGILFGLTSVVHSAGAQPQATLVLWSIGTGFLAAIFFFAVRNVYATAVAVALAGTFLSAGGIDPAYLAEPLPWVALSAGIATIALAGVHLYLFRNFTTIRIPVLPENAGKPPQV
jgi:hypothetical protein